MRNTSCALTLCTVTLIASAQQTSPIAQQTSGTVTGHVYCSDTNSPARLAMVTLQPVPDPNLPEAHSAPGPSNRPPLSSYQTLLDGSFTIPRVKPGAYYVIVQYPGYQSPIAQISKEDLAHPTPELKKVMANLLPSISVDANRTSTLDVRLQRAASISGTVSYDDGSPAPGLPFRVLRQDKSKQDRWTTVQTGAGYNSFISDDEGRFRIINLPAGEYILETNLEISDNYVDQVLGGTQMTTFFPKYNLPIYSGSATRQRDAKSIKVSDGEDHSGEEILIPVAKLHSVTGTLIKERGGHVINSGRVALLNADDNSEMVSTKVDPDDWSFHFSFVPEGSYILSVTEARDVRREQTPMPPGTSIPLPPSEITLHNYGNSQQSLVITGDMTGVTVPVPEKGAASAATPSSNWLKSD